MPKVSVLDGKLEELAEKYENGASCSQLAKEFEVSEGTVRNFLVKNNIKLRENPKAPKGYEKYHDQIRKLNDEGVSAYQMSIDLNIPIVSLARELKKLEIDISHRSKHRKDPIKNHTQEIITLYKNGSSEGKIAKIYGCAESSVSRLLKSNGVEIRF